MNFTIAYVAVATFLAGIWHQVQDASNAINMAFERQAEALPCLFDPLNCLWAVGPEAQFNTQEPRHSSFINNVVSGVLARHRTDTGIFPQDQCPARTPAEETWEVEGQANVLAFELPVCVEDDFWPGHEDWIHPPSVWTSIFRAGKKSTGSLRGLGSRGKREVLARWNGLVRELLAASRQFQVPVLALRRLGSRLLAEAADLGRSTQQGYLRTSEALQELLAPARAFLGELLVLFDRYRNPQFLRAEAAEEFAMLCEMPLLGGLLALFFAYGLCRITPAAISYFFDFNSRQPTILTKSLVAVSSIILNIFVRNLQHIKSFSVGVLAIIGWAICKFGHKVNQGKEDALLEDFDNFVSPIALQARHDLEEYVEGTLRDLDFFWENYTPWECCIKPFFWWIITDNVLPIITHVAYGIACVFWAIGFLVERYYRPHEPFADVYPELTQLEARTIWIGDFLNRCVDVIKFLVDFITFLLVNWYQWHDKFLMGYLGPWLKANTDYLYDWITVSRRITLSERLENEVISLRKEKESWDLEKDVMAQLDSGVLESLMRGVAWREHMKAKGLFPPDPPEPRGWARTVEGIIYQKEWKGAERTILPLITLLAIFGFGIWSWGQLLGFWWIVGLLAIMWVNGWSHLL